MQLVAQNIMSTEQQIHNSIPAYSKVEKPATIFSLCQGRGHH